MSGTISKLEAIVQWQAEKNIMDSTLKQYLGRVKTLTDLLYSYEELRELTLECNEQGEFLKHTGKAHRLYKLKMPMTVDHVKYLFALVATDTRLAKPGKKMLTAIGVPKMKLAPTVTGNLHILQVLPELMDQRKVKFV